MDYNYIYVPCIDDNKFDIIINSSDVCDITVDLCDTQRVDIVSRKISIAPCRASVKNVIFNDPATIIFWNDGSTTVVKCQGGEPFDAEKGFVMAYLKKLLGNDNTFNKVIKKWV